MTPDEYRQKYKSCYTCEYYQKANSFELKGIKLWLEDEVDDE